MRRCEDWPLVTICIPAFNAEATLARTLESILAQDYPNFEVIVSDNRSTDDTAQIVRGYAARGIRYFLKPEHSDLAEPNWNYVLSLASGPFIALYHADDLYTPTMVRRQVEFLQAHPEVSSVFTMTQMIDEHDRLIRMGSTRLPDELRGRGYFDFPTLLNAVLKYGNFMIVPTMMTRREILDAAGVFRWEKFASASDIDLYLRMAQWGPIGIIDEPLHRYRISAEQGSAQLNRLRTYLAHFFVVLDCYLEMPEVKQFAQPQAVALYQMQRAADQVLCAMNLLALGRGNEARARLREALHWRHFVTALRRPRLLGRLVVGICLRVSLYGGFGTSLGRQVLRAYQRDLQRRRKPMEG